MIIIIIHIFIGGFNNVVCWQPVFLTFPVCVSVLLRGVEKVAQTQSGLGKELKRMHFPIREIEDRNDPINSDTPSPKFDTRESELPKLAIHKK